MTPSLTEAETPAYVDRLLVVERDRFRLTLYDLPWRGAEKYGIKERYSIAIGAAGFNTPRGLYRINTKVKDPDWLMPNSDWVPEELRGTVVPGGDPANPLRERWLGITEPAEGIGIHGTAETTSIGKAASHGCVRMAPGDVIDLYSEVPLGTPILII